jgi:hypothetical protein
MENHVPTLKIETHDNYEIFFEKDCSASSVYCTLCGCVVIYQHVIWKERRVFLSATAD